MAWGTIKQLVWNRGFGFINGVGSIVDIMPTSRRGRRFYAPEKASVLEKLHSDGVRVLGDLQHVILTEGRSKGMFISGPGSTGSEDIVVCTGGAKIAYKRISGDTVRIEVKTLPVKSACGKFGSRLGNVTVVDKGKGMPPK